MENNTNQMVDCIDNPLQVGDIVLRSCYSSISFHRVLKINNKSIKLSRGIGEVTGTGGYVYYFPKSSPTLRDVDMDMYNNNPKPITLSVHANKADTIFKIEQ